ncbi:hypothetical protein DC31_03565 [Microbacterium sp. CH12i]|nr:hypothetical protein DC31_03565 [Microbacterium sp. CH12i]
MRDLHSHVTESAESDDGDLLAGAGVPVAQRRVGGDSRAQQGSGLLEGDGFWHPQYETLGDNDRRRVATLRDGAIDIGGTIGSGRTVQAVLLFAGSAARAFAAGVHQASDAHTVADGELRYFGADLGDSAGDLVSDSQRVLLGPPVALDRMNIGVADARPADVDAYILGADVAAFDRARNERVGGRGRNDGGDCCRHASSLNRMPRSWLE